jgi:hypothetical protein
MSGQSLPRAPGACTNSARDQCRSAITTITTTTTRIPAAATLTGRWRHQKSGFARSRVYRPSGGIPTQSSSSSYPLTPSGYRERPNVISAALPAGTLTW